MVSESENSVTLFVMKQRLLTGWSVRRVIYLVGGAGMSTYFFMDKMWLMGIVSLYFVGMGIFAFGCAGGQCAVNPSKESGELSQNP